jgi:hypothetical protein
MPPDPDVWVFSFPWVDLAGARDKGYEIELKKNTSAKEATSRTGEA